MEFNKRKMSINITKVMVLGKQQENTRIELEGIELEQVDTFRYLGAKIDNQGIVMELK